MLRAAASEQGTRFMKTNAVRFAAGLALFAIGAPLPACAQFLYPPIVIVTPPAQDYGAQKPKPLPDKPKPADTQAQTGGHYEGRRWIPD
jgi:hypothetical protein